MKDFWHFRRPLYVKQTNLNPVSQCKLKYFGHILRKQVTTFGVFSDYDKIVLAPTPYTHNEIRIRRIQVTLSSVPSESITKNLMGDYIVSWLKGKKCKFFLLACGEYAKPRKKY
jgi:hypothetical protein